MATINVVLQGKGGVGKSVIAALLAQYLRDRGQAPICIDTDPVNATLYSYKELDVHRCEVMEGDDIDRSKFDALLETALQAEPQQQVVVDNGASTFVALSSYLINFQVAEMLAEMGHELVIHCVVTGGKPQDDTMQSLLSILRNYTDVRIVTWLNPYFGAIERKGKPFRELAIYQNNAERLETVLELPKADALSSADFEHMLKRAETFEAALKSEELLLMERRRLQLLRDAIYRALDEACLAETVSCVA